LTENFRNWLDVIYQSIIAALQSKADNTQVEDIARQVQDAAGRASQSVAWFAKKALGGRCACCDMPLPEESMQWKRPVPSTSQGRWFPNSSPGAVNNIRPPSVQSKPKGFPVPACGPSKLPKLQDLRQSDLGDLRVQRDFPKGKVLKAAASDSQLRAIRAPDFMM